MVAFIILFAMEVEAQKRAFNALYTDIKITITDTAEDLRHQISEKKEKRDKAEAFYINRIMAKMERAERLRKEKARQAKREKERQRQANYGSGHLTKSAGVYYFGNQRETYYNLPMEGVIATARYNGIGGEYWIRSDGCKMLGDYIILACNRDVHPYGSIVLTSLGYGISLDTGGFAYDYPYGVDIAVNW